MISKPTLFVIGAGASYPFGLPTGQGLRAAICQELQMQSAFRDLLMGVGHSEQQIREFSEDFKYSGLNSIDSFLATRPDHHDIGLQAIAAALLPSESLTRLYATADGRFGTSDWLGYLWNRMRDGAQRPEDIADNQVQFVTFNYDRSVEVFLLNAVQRTFALSVDAAQEIVSALPIHHMYGSLGGFVPGVGYDYGGTKTPARIREAAEGLKVIPATRPDSDPTCYPFIREAVRVFFLGFGFDPANCDRLGFRLVKEQQGTGGKVNGTAFGLTKQEAGLASMRVTTANCQVHLHEMDCLTLLREYASLLY